MFIDSSKLKVPEEIIFKIQEGDWDKLQTESNYNVEGASYLLDIIVRKGFDV